MKQPFKKSLYIFDLDGVLIDTKEIHYNCLNKALSKISSNHVISKDEHLCIFDGLSTYEKLNLLTLNKGLPKNKHTEIWELKQKYVSETLSLIKPSSKLKIILKYIRKNGGLIACCSNSIKNTVNEVLTKLDISVFFDLRLSNEDVKNPKPHPEIYWKAMSHFNLTPKETVIFEDSPNGLLAAQLSGATVVRVKNPEDLNMDKLKNLNVGDSDSILKWRDDSLNVLIPMAGAGSRFERAGYTFPKPLIDVNGKPMIQAVVDNLAIEANYIFIVQKKHRIKYNLDSVLNLIASNVTIVEVDGLTEGAACTTLLAQQYIDNDKPLLIANSDQLIEWSSSKFMYKVQEQNLDAGILTFNSTHPKWSYVRVDENDCIIEVAEKKPISNQATVGIYFWKKGSDYVKYSKQMIQKNIKTNNEFYVCPVFNEAIQDGKKVSAFKIDKMWGLGTPEDLQYYMDKHKK